MTNSNFSPAQNMETFFNKLHDDLPTIFDRGTAVKIMGGILSSKTLANADSGGTGPKVKLKIGKKVVYEREAFIEWLKSKVR